MNINYHIRRDSMLAALGMKELSREQTETLLFRDVRVRIGRRVGMGSELILPAVLVFPPGHTANRIRVGCPKCGKVMRFCALQQHVDTKVCQEQVEKGKHAAGGRYGSYQ